MIELPSFATMGRADPVFIDAGFNQSGIQSDDYIPRKGGRYRVSCAYGPFHPEQGRVMVARLIAGKQGGIRIPLPLQHSQGSPGSPLLNGAVTSGRTLVLDGLTPGYTCKEGYWLSLEKDGQHYLHNVRTGGRASDTGTLTIVLNELVRTSFPDNTVVHLAKPMVQGLVQGDEVGWALSVDQMTPIEFTIKEKK